MFTFIIESLVCLDAKSFVLQKSILIFSRGAVNVISVFLWWTVAFVGDRRGVKFVFFSSWPLWPYVLKLTWLMSWYMKAEW